MPYPVETLPYPFKKRLRQLLTPIETLQFQKATGRLEDKRYLLPIQEYQQCSKVFVSFTDNNLISNWWLDDADDSDEELPIEPGKCVYYPEHIHLHDLLESHLTDPIFDYVLFDKADALTLSSDEITESLLLALASKKLKLTTFVHGVRVPEVFDADAPRLQAYFDVFPTMTACFRPCPAYEGWLQDLIEINKPDLSYFNIASDDCEKLFSFNYENMLELFKLQCNGFSLNLEYKVDDLTAIDLDDFSLLLQPLGKTVETKIDLNLCIRVFDEINEDQYLQWEVCDVVQNDSTKETKWVLSFSLFFGFILSPFLCLVIFVVFNSKTCQSYFS